MKEDILQKEIVEVIKKSALLEFIKGKETINEALEIDFDSNNIPEFSFDSLLKKRCSQSAQRVIESLGHYEIISGESIKNISLKHSERLFPDLILFNRQRMQIIIVENKTSGKTEREAITELMGYSHEIKNHLPFMSNYDINYILIATEYNELLNHSISAQILTAEINFLCLKPTLSNNKITGLLVHLPSAWSDLGDAGIPENAIASYTMCLYEKDEFKIKEFDSYSVVNIAADLILNSANSFHSSGFFIIWQNAHQSLNSGCHFAISLYVLNPFPFLVKAHENKLPLNEKSALSKFLLKHIKEFGSSTPPSSLFGIAKKAEAYLEKYFNVDWQRDTNWVVDTKDKLYALQRNVAFWDSWGAIGDFVRYLYLHPSSSNYSFTPYELKGGGYKDPFVGLQIINKIAGNINFKYGDFSNKEIFQFGLQIGFYLQACNNAMSLDESKAASYNANLFWNALPLIQSLKEVGHRISDSIDLEVDAVSFPLALSRVAIKDDYQIKISNFLNWFIKDFIDSTNNPTISYIFLFAVEYCWYFDQFYINHINHEDALRIEKELATTVKETLCNIANDRIKKPAQNKKILLHLNKVFFKKRIKKIKPEKFSSYLNKQTDTFYSENFDEFLELLDLIKPALLHSFKPIKIPNSIDWNKLYESSCNLFEQGERTTAIIIGSNGIIGLGKINVPVMRLSSKEEIFIQLPNEDSINVIIKKVQWIDIKNNKLNIQL